MAPELVFGPASDSDSDLIVCRATGKRCLLPALCPVIVTTLLGSNIEDIVRYRIYRLGIRTFWTYTYQCFRRQSVAQFLLLLTRLSNDHLHRGPQFADSEFADCKLVCDPAHHTCPCAVRPWLILASMLPLLRYVFPCSSLVPPRPVLMGQISAIFRASLCGQRHSSAAKLASQVPPWWLPITDTVR